VISVWVFAIFVAIAVWYRRRPAIHKPMMVMATLMAIPAAVGRIEPLNALYRGTIWETVFGPFFGTLVIGAALLLLGWALSRRFDRWFAIGYATVVLISAGIVELAPTTAWAQVAGWLTQ
jgi:hypothetical protein